MKLNEQMIDDLAHEIFIVSQLMPGEGIEDVIYRIKDILRENFKSLNSKGSQNDIAE